MLPNKATRTRLVDGLKRKEIYAYICYVPLHSAPFGQKHGYKPEDCPITENLGERVLRLPLYADMTEGDVDMVVESIENILR